MSRKKTEQARNSEVRDEDLPDSEPEDETGEAQEAPTEVDQLKKEVAEARAEAAETYDRLLRLSAEFENYKKRMQRQAEDHRKYANESIIKDLLSVVDNLERAVNASRQSDSQADACMLEGLEMTLNEIRKVLKKYHVEPVEAVGQPFDPTYHEAVMQQPSEDYPDNTVIQEMQKGYMLHDRLIRPAMVVVAKAPA
ncbi:molecular chaperone GrpE [Desulfosalsimonas propionicica]|uniref:Protein GrpE n=1 Tax=Desulfosalsimonas propionicica TaxID=332175 RepID=A0A7W0C6B2_9BACT|nr:nucleotide exchange factor GrpE [Desulfosalsimonas propionicica]MBA2879922.1 molecular chaperone GrpE [Desulfosalsimonas propionicica]